MKSQIELYGHSGFDVFMYENGAGQYIVRKKAKRPGQNPRLKRQFFKHKFFWKMRQPWFFVPEIAGFGTEDGLFYYEYRYVEGVTLIHYIEKNRIEPTIRVFEKLIKILEFFKSSAQPYEKTKMPKAFKESIIEKTGSIIKKHPECAKLCRQLAIKLNKLSDTAEKTVCHGDLSFDNIIIDDRHNIWLIDFLDIFYPHHQLDIAKLFSDIDGKWHEFKYGIILPKNKLAYIREYLFRQVQRLDPTYPKYHNLLIALVFLRILPYVNDERQKTIIMEKAHFFINQRSHAPKNI